MNPEEFKKKMEALRSDDEEYSHRVMDDLMCELLTELGYGEGVKIFDEQGKWYS